MIKINFFSEDFDNGSMKISFSDIQNGIKKIRQNSQANQYLNNSRLR